MAVKPLVFCLTASGYEVARQAALTVDGELRISPAASGQFQCRTYSDLSTEMRDAFIGGRPVIGVCAAAIIIRILAPFLSGKRHDAPVLCIPEDANSVIPLLGGHHGANPMANQLAQVLDSHAAISTASDLRLGVPLDCPPPHWTLENPGDVKDMVLAILNGSIVTITGSACWTEPLTGHSNITFRRDCGDSESIRIAATGCVPLVYRRHRYVIGVGCVRGCSVNELRSLVLKTLDNAGIRPASIAGMYSIDLKADEPAIHSLASELNSPVRFFDAPTLEQEFSRLTQPSERVFLEVGCHGVCEAASLAAAGPSGELVVPKVKSATATCAIARIGSVRGKPGMPRGQLNIVGIGPGFSEWRTPQATRALAAADLVVGYSRYLELVTALIGASSEIASFPLGQEIDRCRHALEQAALGRNVALVCSGDSGIYAMAPLVLELLSLGAKHGGVSPAARRVRIVSVPGVSAMQAASAKTGAILGHDFCAISLSDLLTPREHIHKRIKAAAESDFVIAFYNPASRRRQELIVQAMKVLRDHRPASTPVVLARNVGRRGEHVLVNRLDAFDPKTVDMSTVVIVGNSSSRFLDKHPGIPEPGFLKAFTPRGYIPGN